MFFHFYCLLFFCTEEVHFILSLLVLVVIIILFSNPIGFYVLFLLISLNLFCKMECSIEWINVHIIILLLLHLYCIITNGLLDLPRINSFFMRLRTKGTPTKNLEIPNPYQLITEPFVPWWPCLANSFSTFLISNPNQKHIRISSNLTLFEGSSTYLIAGIPSYKSLHSKKRD